MSGAANPPAPAPPRPRARRGRRYLASARSLARTFRLPRWLTTLPLRLLAFNLLLVFLPAAGLLYLDDFEKQMLAAQERSMVQQGRLLAAALSAAGDLNPTSARAILERLDQRQDARLRVLDRTGLVLADTSLLGPRRSSSESVVEARTEAADKRRGWLYRFGSFLYSLAERLLGSHPVELGEEFEASGGRLLGPEIESALAGRYGATTRLSKGGQRSVHLYSAIPVRSADGVIGAVLVSQSTYRILQALYSVRVGIFRVILVSIAIAAVLSAVVSATIARPLRHLRRQASEILDRRGRLLRRFRGSLRADEIGDLTRALHELTRRLEERMHFIESFAADVSHEFRNPLASIRTAAEMLPQAEAAGERQRFLQIVEQNVARMEHLLSGAREVSRIDACLDDETPQPVPLDGLLDTVIAGYRLRLGEKVRFAFTRPGGAAAVSGVPERLTQLFEKVLDNAVSFTPLDGTISIDVSLRDGSAVVTIADEGPGIPEEHLQRVFDRFFTYRPGPDQARSQHIGIGLAIVKAIAQGYGGAVVARNRPEGGSCFEVTLPLAVPGERLATAAEAKRAKG